MDRIHMNGIKGSQLDKKEKNNLIIKIAERLNTLSEIVFAYVYGSYLEGGYFRDIDIAIYVKGTPVDSYFEFEECTDRELNQLLDVKASIDVRIINKSPIILKYQVLKGQLIVDHDDEKRVDFMVNVISRYLDLQPILQYQQREAFIH